MTQFLTKTLLGATLALSLIASPVAQAQDLSGPADMPDEISALFADAEEAGSDVSFAPPEDEPAMQGEAAESGDEAATAAAKRYIYTTLRVVANGNSRGCRSSDWNCMTRLCKADLRSQSAWRGWAGCWKKGSKYVCYFECGQTRNAF